MSSTKLRVVFRLSALGDVVLCSAFTKALQSQNPKDKIIFLTSETVAPFVRDCFDSVDEVKGLKAHGAREWFKLGQAMAEQISASNEELVGLYDLHGVSKSFFFFWGFQHQWKKKTWGKKIKSRPLFLKTKKFFWKRMLSVLLRKDLLGRRFVFRDHLSLLQPLNQNFHPTLRSNGTSKNKAKILLAPDARHWKKRWPSHLWLELIQALLAHAAQFEITLVGSEDCLPMKELQNLAHPRLLNLLGKTSLTELPKLAAEHGICVCSNSAWLHISEAVGTPVVTLAGPIVPGFGFSPWQSQSIELSLPLSCRPCTRHGSGRCWRKKSETLLCMTGIEAKDVLRSIQQILGSRAVTSLTELL